jgi:hypothetical protein
LSCRVPNPSRAHWRRNLLLMVLAVSGSRRPIEFMAAAAGRFTQRPHLSSRDLQVFGTTAVNLALSVSVLRGRFSTPAQLSILMPRPELSVARCPWGLIKAPTARVAGLSNVSSLHAVSAPRSTHYMGGMCGRVIQIIFEVHDLLEQVGAPFVVQPAAWDRLLKAGQSVDDVRAKEVVALWDSVAVRSCISAGFAQWPKRECGGPTPPRRKGKSADRAANPQSVAIRPDTRLARLVAAVAGRPSLTGLLTLSADEGGRQKVESDIRDKPASRLLQGRGRPRRPAPYGDAARAVRPRVRLAHGDFEALRRDGKRVIAKCPFMSSYAARHPEYGALLDG